jgi:hypothetical protein
LVYGADLSTNLAEICHQELATSWKMEARTEPVATFGAIFSQRQAEILYLYFSFKGKPKKLLTN